MSKIFGSVVQPCIRGFYIKKGSQGRCVFQVASGDNWLCGIQDTKPSACRLWPFRVYKDATCGRAEEALYNYKSESFYIYIDPECTGLVYGTPSPELVTKTIPEFIEISLGRRDEQFYSTHHLASKTVLSCKRYTAGLLTNGRVAARAKVTQLRRIARPRAMLVRR